MPMNTGTMERFYIVWPKLLLRRWQPTPKVLQRIFFLKLQIFNQLQVRYKYSMAQLYLTENYNPDTGVGLEKLLLCIFFRSRTLFALSTMSGCPAQRVRVRWKCQHAMQRNRTQEGARWSQPRWKCHLSSMTLHSWLAQLVLVSERVMNSSSCTGLANASLESGLQVKLISTILNLELLVTKIGCSSLLKTPFSFHALQNHITLGTVLHKQRPAEILPLWKPTRHSSTHCLLHCLPWGSAQAREDWNGPFLREAESNQNYFTRLANNLNKVNK